MGEKWRSEMKRIVLLLIALMVVLSGCGTATVASTPSPSPTPSSSPKTIETPSPSPSRTPLNLAQVASEMSTALYNIQLITSKYPTYNDKSLPGTPTVLRYSMVFTGKYWYWGIEMDNFTDAQTHISLADKGKLPNETYTHPVDKSVLVQEVSSALISLNAERDLVIKKEGDCVEWIKKYPSYTTAPVLNGITEEFRAQSINDAVLWFDELADKINKINNRLKIILALIEAST
jgi:hypothetical protein